jgi:hypothetical protein
MTVDPATAAGHRGTVYFCSAGCAAAYDAEPVDGHVVEDHGGGDVGLAARCALTGPDGTDRLGCTHTD